MDGHRQPGPGYYSVRSEQASQKIAKGLEQERIVVWHISPSSLLLSWLIRREENRLSFAEPE